MRFTLFTFLFLTGPLVAMTTLFYNAEIRILDPQGTSARWLLVTDGKVVDFGRGTPPKTIVPKVDLGKSYVLPSLTDAHAHLTSIGQALFEIDLRGTKSPEEAVKRVLSFAGAHPDLKGALVGNGWDQSDWPGQKFPNRNLLDKVPTTRPIVLYRVDGHAAWVNTAALQSTSLWKMPTNPEGGKIVRDKKGNPSGILIDKAMGELSPLFSDPSEKELELYIRKAVDSALALGITSIHDAGASRHEIETIRRLLQKKAVKFRFVEMVSAKKESELAHFLKKGPEIGLENGQLTVATVKLFLDGAMGSRGAFFEEPYEDDPTNHGLLMMSPEKLVGLIRRIDSAGFQVAVHAIGSKANSIVLDAYEKVMGDKTAVKRPRLEHAQVLTKTDMERIAKMGVIASMQPVHCTSDMKWVNARIGKTRARSAYAWRSLLDKKVPLAFGSDAPVENVNPWPGLFAAVTRQDAQFLPKEGFFSEEKISLPEALAAFTKGPAYAAFAEKSLGSLEKGKWADFIVLSTDPMKVSLTDLRQMRVEETFIAGEKVYSRAHLLIP